MAKSTKQSPKPTPPVQRPPSPAPSPDAAGTSVDATAPGGALHDSHAPSSASTVEPVGGPLSSDDAAHDAAEAAAAAVAETHIPHDLMPFTPSVRRTYRERHTPDPTFWIVSARRAFTLFGTPIAAGELLPLDTVLALSERKLRQMHDARLLVLTPVFDDPMVPA